MTLADQLINALRQNFQQYVNLVDTNQDSSIDRNELINFFMRNGIHPNMAPNMAEQVFQQLDKNHDQRISVEDFNNNLSSGSTLSAISETFINAFQTNFQQLLQYYDTNRDQTIDINELTSVLQSSGYGQMSYTIAREVFQTLDRDHDNRVTFQEATQKINLNAQKVTIGTAEVRQIINSQLRGKLQPQLVQGAAGIYLADNTYYCPSVYETSQILQRTAVDKRTWTENRFDCDDFAYVLKGEFSKAAYENKNRKLAYCVGIVWGNLPGPHAINWVINDDKRLRFIEPQRDTIYFPGVNDGNIYLMVC